MNRKALIFILIVVCLCLFVACGKKASKKEEAFKLASDYLKQATTVKEICPYKEDIVKEMGSSSFDINGWYKDNNDVQHNFEIVVNKENGSWKVGFTSF